LYAFCPLDDVVFRAGHSLLFSIFRYFNAAIRYRYSATFLNFAIRNRVGTKVFVFVFRESFREIHFSFLQNICDEYTKISQKFSRKLRDKKPQLKNNQLKFFCFKLTGNKYEKHNIFFMRKAQPSRARGEGFPSNTTEQNIMNVSGSAFRDIPQNKPLFIYLYSAW
jgi:hypothetical protein